MSEVQLVDLLKAGVHFGHQRSRWHPKMAPFIFTVRNEICIIDLEQTAARLKKAVAFAEEVAARNGKVLFVGTKRQAQPIVREAAARVRMPSVSERWVGGTFTNFTAVSKILNKLTQLKSDRDSGRLEKYTKKERLVIEREIQRLEKIVGGIEHLDKLPDAVFVVDIKNERTVVKEAQKVGIPIIAMCDTNVDPTPIAYPIPANDDATKSINLIANAIADAIERGNARADKTAADAATAAAEAAEAAEIVVKPEPLPPAIVAAEETSA